MPQTYTVKKDYHNSRFDRWFKANVINLPQSLIEKIIRLNKIKINRKKTKTSYRVQLGDIVEVFNISKFKISDRPKISKYKPSRKEVDIYDDYILENNDNFIVINKPAGIAVQSGTKSFRNIIDVLKDTKYFENTKPYIVHRLDKDTSGVFIMAKHREAAQLLTSLFRLRKVHKTYLAICHGELQRDSGEWNDDLTRYDNDKEIIEKARTTYKVLDKNSICSLVEMKPITGRKHQLRKQLYAVGSPIYGDQKYKFSNTDKAINKNLMLHSYQIKFIIKDKKYTYTALLPDYFKKLLKTKRLRFPSS